MKVCIIYNENWDRESISKEVEHLDYEILRMQKLLNFVYSPCRASILQSQIARCMQKRDSLDDQLYIPPQICIIDGRKWS
jgi:hypothetical protein